MNEAREEPCREEPFGTAFGARVRVALVRSGSPEAASGDRGRADPGPKRDPFWTPFGARVRVALVRNASVLGGGIPQDRAGPGP